MSPAVCPTSLDNYRLIHTSYIQVFQRPMRLLSTNQGQLKDNHTSFFFFFFFFLFGGKEGNAFMHHNALRRRVWDSSAGCRWANVPVGQGIPHDYPLKTPYAGITSHIPLREIDRRTCQGSNGKVLPVGPWVRGHSLFHQFSGECFRY